VSCKFTNETEIEITRAPAACFQSLFSIFIYHTAFCIVVAGPKLTPVHYRTSLQKNQIIFFLYGGMQVQRNSVHVVCLSSLSLIRESVLVFKWLMSMPV